MNQKEPFCESCRDSRRIGREVPSELKYGHYCAMPCPECSVPISLVPARILGAFGQSFVVAR